MRFRTRLVAFIVGLLFIAIGLNLALCLMLMPETPDEDKTDWPLHVDITMWSMVFSVMVTMVLGVGLFGIAIQVERTQGGTHDQAN